MRVIPLSDGQPFDVRPLTRGEIREMAKAGLPVTAAGFAGGITFQNYESTFDAVVATQAPDMDRLAMPDYRKLFDAIVAETWGSKDEEKNSPTPGPSAQAGSK